MLRELEFSITFMEYNEQQFVSLANEVPMTREERIKPLIELPFVDEYKPLHQLGPNHVIHSENLWTTESNGHVKLELQWRSGPPPQSLITLYKEQVESTPNLAALVVKREHYWFKWTYSQFWNESRTTAKAFIKLGLKAFHGVGILGFNSPEWVFSVFGAILASGLPAGIHITNSPDACCYILSYSKANIVVVDDDSQLKKILEIRDKLPNLKAIIQYIGESSHPDVLSWRELLEIGNSVPDEILDRRIKGLSINQCCMLVFTAGTTGISKPVMLSHDNIFIGVHESISNANITFSECKTLESRDCHCISVSYLPLSHIDGLMAEIFLPLAKGVTIYFAPPNVFKGGLVDFLREVRPAFLFGVPPVLEKIYENLKLAEVQMSFFRRVLLRCACLIGYAYAENIQKGNESKPYCFTIANNFVFSKIKEALGFDRLSSCWIGGAPVNPKVLKFFWSLNIFMFESYGLIENSGTISVSNITAFRKGSPGKVNELSRVKIHNRDSDGCGEICVRGRSRFMGYMSMAEETTKAISDDGWFHTGDLGRIDEDGFLYIVGRLKEMIITAGGKNICPIPIEEAVKSEISIVRNAMLVGDNKKFISMLLTLETNTDPTSLIPTNELTVSSRNWCRSIGSNAKTAEDILKGTDTKVMKAIQEGIDRVNNKSASNVEKIKKWVILPKDFSIPGGELTPTLKLKRKFVLEKYSQIIEELYINSMAAIV